MKEEYLKFKFLDSLEWGANGIKFGEFLQSLPKEVGTLLLIEFIDYVSYDIVTKNGRQLHRLDGPAFIPKNMNVSPAYYVYGICIGNTKALTFEEFEIQRDKILKEMVFK